MLYANSLSYFTKACPKNIGRVKDPNPGRVLIRDTFLFQVRADEEIIAGFQNTWNRKNVVPTIVYHNHHVLGPTRTCWCHVHVPTRTCHGSLHFFSLEKCYFSMSYNFRSKGDFHN